MGTVRDRAAASQLDDEIVFPGGAGRQLEKRTAIDVCHLPFLSGDVDGVKNKPSKGTAPELSPTDHVVGARKGQWRGSEWQDQDACLKGAYCSPIGLCTG
jgi:hypothetical protein